MMTSQAGILEPVPAVARYVFFALQDAPDGAVLREAIARLAGLADGKELVVGLGPELARTLGASVPDLREFPHLTGPGIDVPSTPAALLCWLRGRDRGDLLHLTRRIEKAVAPA